MFSIVYNKCTIGGKSTSTKYFRLDFKKREICTLCIVYLRAPLFTVIKLQMTHQSILEHIIKYIRAIETGTF